VRIAHLCDAKSRQKLWQSNRYPTFEFIEWCAVRTLQGWLLNRSVQAKVLYFIDPLIKLDRRRIALAATAAAGSARGQFAEIPLADPFAEHASQGLGIDVEMIG